MTLKGRLTKAGTLLALAALFLLFVTGGVLFFVFYTQSHSLQFVELDANAARVETLLEQSEAPEAIAEAVGAYSYELIVTHDGATIFSNIREYQQRVLTAANAAGWVGDDTQYLLVDGVTLVRARHEPFVYTALHDASSIRRHFTLTEIFLLSYLALGLSTITIIVFVYNRLAKQFVERILTPIDDLVKAAQRVGEGDLSQPISCEDSAELEPVMIAFNNMQEHLISERERIEAYEKSRTDLVAGISHDLRTPLTAVKGYIKGLQDGIANTPEKQARYLEIAYRRTGDVERLLHQLFLFSKMETGNLELNRENVDLEEVLQKTVYDLNRELNAEQGYLVFEAGEGLHPVSVDMEQLARILANLTENSMKYAGVSPVRMSLSLRREADGEHVLFSDNGQGVPEEALPMLFEEFWREDKARSGKKNKGSGLGLYIVRYLVEAHGGRVTAYNQDGLVIEMVFPEESSSSILL